MKSFLSEIIADPVSGNDLKLKNGKLIDPVSGKEYDIQEDIPVLLPPANAKKVSKDALHKRTDTAFDYQDHYQKDAEFFDYFESYEDGATRHEERRLHEAIIADVPHSAALVLDAGCGKGWVAEYFCPRGKKVISMDISTVNPLKALAKTPDVNHAGLVGDVFYLPLRENSVDCIIAAEIMEHVADPRLFVQQLYKTLTPGGTIIITTPYNEKIEYSLCVHCNRPTPRHAHLHSFHEHNIEALIPSSAVYWTWSKFSNKYLAKLRSHVVLKYMPYQVWNFIDRIANKIKPQPLRLMIKIQKGDHG